MKKYQQCFISINYVISSRGLVDIAFLMSDNSFVGSPYTYSSNLFNGDTVPNRNILSLVQRYQNNLFIF